MAAKIRKNLIAEFYTVTIQASLLQYINDLELSSSYPKSFHAFTKPLEVCKDLSPAYTAKHCSGVAPESLAHLLIPLK